MKKHLFLIGPSGCGKTTMLRNALGDKLAEAGGFVTERVCRADGSVEGYDLLPAAAAGGVEGYERARFLDYTKNPPKSDNEVFRNEAVKLLKEAAFYPYAVIDEFGGYEMVIPQFREALLDILSSELPIIGVLKDAGNGETLRRRIGLGEKYTLYRDRLEEALRNDCDTLILDTSGRYDEKAHELVRRWAEEYAL
ncbi:MAG: nucleoside-triphosphatase [Candidatus Limivicinus sp.]|jgi:nucleoside-triphosphatase THEP1